MSTQIMHIYTDMFATSNIMWGSLAPQTNAAPGTALAGADGDGDSDGSGASVASQSAAGAGGGNPLLQALAQALESLGMTLSSAPSAAGPSGAPAAASAGAAPSSTSPASSAPASTGTAGASTTQSSGSASPPASASREDGDDDSHQGHSIARDIRRLVHALFEDIRAENVLAPSPSAAPASTASTASSSTAGAASSSAAGATFASGLASLISQIQSGTVPANLQRAFDRLVTDLERIGGTASAPASTSATSAPAPAASTTASAAAATPTTTAASPAAATPAAAPATTGTTPAASASSASASSTAPAQPLNYQALLLQFLTNLQKDLGLGYGASAGAPAQSSTSGLLVNTVA